MKNQTKMMLVVCLMAVSTPMAALAAAQDYAFEAVKTEVRNGPGSDIAVRLVHKPSGKPVEDAVIFRTRLDMSPENMEGMTTKIEPLTESEPGVYKFRADFTMAGGWALKLQAKVQGEPETVQGTVVFTAKD
ncbi:FixH family protein [Hyphomicrobium sp.]|jgi:hypothetical protein|uniref:FixH family protein n=1 Tax=Hyphomicrobium sp. TaxID=82 RepID=UPI0025C18F06|nr:FixH family protein [Hyphomicrobium sp.]